jgi:TRAP-type C4-dicarboxylate transport system permease small subunit
MRKLLYGVDALTKIMMVVAAFCAFGLAFAILLDVLARNTGIKFYGVPEYIRNWLIVIVFLQLPFAVRIRSMLAVDIFVSVLPPAARTPLAVFGYILGVIFFGAVAVGGLGPAIDSWVKNEYEGEGVVEVAAWPARFTIVYGCTLAAFYYLVRIYEVWKGRTTLTIDADLPKPVEHL